MIPMVSILALCYNHGQFLDEALLSIEQISFPKIQVLVADDASQDDSIEKLKIWQFRRPDWTFVFHKQNKGNCRTFNELLALAQGEFILDFATDDVLIPQEIEGWVKWLKLNPNAAFCYADAWIFSAKSKVDCLFSESRKEKEFPTGNILGQLFSPDFICPPAVLFRKSALIEIGGYDSDLAYEDWDTWLRLARKYSVCYHSQPVIRYRKHPNSLSASILRNRNQNHIQSTLIVLQRTIQWKELKGNLSWIPFARYHLKITGALQIPHLAKGFFYLLKNSNSLKISDLFWLFLSRVPLPFYPITQRFLR